MSRKITLRDVIQMYRMDSSRHTFVFQKLNISIGIQVYHLQNCVGLVIKHGSGDMQSVYQFTSKRSTNAGEELF